MKRLISANSSEILAMSSEELKSSIKASEGRVVLSENIVARETFIGDITNAEIAKSFGADLILLNFVDVFHPVISGLDCQGDGVVKRLHHLVGAPIGVNLEPVDSEATMLEDLNPIAKGRQASKETFKKIEELGFDFVCLTGNPASGVSNQAIHQAIKLAKKYFSGLVIAGKMHGSGVDEALMDKNTAELFLSSGADIILVPAVGTVPGVTSEELRELVQFIHKRDSLVMSAIGTSQECADSETVRQIAIQNKICGVDIQHIGDSGYGGLAPVDNIYAMSVAIRGVRHTVSRLARSINR